MILGGYDLKEGKDILLLRGRRQHENNHSFTGFDYCWNLIC
jgi:hypothetical protein